ncbi:mediator of RNA polymerase II transcription subunit 13-like isoform X2 [Lineus longissimus]|uniref:mediator of RNA polymerase II transcription subunit 13-like isoform X2 n=1 Tax=Lineus longissimus TaxID=88925 RepID=UPI00315D0997
MSHPNTLLNGCSLEDCYTNLFALTDLCGIKWRRYSTDSGHVVEPLEDPVLSSFSRCTKADILCCWKRVQKSSSDSRGNEQYSFSKELWLFWYGGQPSNLQELLSPELTEAEQGSWDAGLSYECRTLLFKALHNLIEGYLLQRNFVRLGKWFVQPYDTSYDCSSSGLSTEKGPHLSISFSFFLHGESTVCSSIDVRQHPPVRPLTMKQVMLCQEATNGVQVLLAPHGLTGVLTGQTFKDSDPVVRKLLEEWLHFYMSERIETANEQKVPSMVEVIVGGVHMKYPSRFVLVTDCDEPHYGNPANLTSNPQMPNVSRMTSLVSSLSLTPPTSPCDAASALEANIKLVQTSLYAQGSVDPGGGLPAADTMTDCLVEKVWQDGCVSAGMKRTQPVDGSGDENGMLGNWDFGEPIQKSHCGCSKLKSKNRSALSAQNKEKTLSSNSKYMKLEKVEKSDKQQSKQSRTPFHRRLEHSEDVVHSNDLDFVMQRVHVAPLTNFKGAVTQANVSLPSLRTTNYDQAVESPNSAVPSPLVASHSQPAITQSASDPTMPTLSPHPPVKNNEKDLSHTNHVQPESQTINGVTGGNVTMNSSGFVGGQASADVYNKPLGSVPKCEPLSIPYQAPVESKPDVVSNWLDLHKHEATHHPGLKRPQLPAASYEEDEEPMGKSLYDFATLNAWLLRPVKKARSNHRTDGHSNSSGSRSLSSHSTPSPVTSCLPMHDPYEFSDESSTNATGFCSRGFRASRDDSFPGGRLIKQEDDDMGDLGSPQTPGAQLGTTSLMSEKDLVPTITDLDRIFDTSGEEDNDDTFQEPMGNGGSRLCDDAVIKGSKGTSLNSSTGAGIIGTTELSRMFPTPPSMENNTSPCNGQADPVHELDPVCAPMEHMASPEAPVKECLFVHKSLPCGQFIGSSKYSPIELPSGKLPSIELNCYYKPSWHYPLPMMEKHPQQSQYSHMPSMENVANMARLPVDRMLSIPASPATFPGSMQQRTPMSYELQSPASNASSYLNKNLNSIDNHGTNSQVPEAHSLTVNLVLSDTILNLFKDHNFDSCNICVCNMSIKGADVGIYIPESLVSQEPQYKCACGFSAVMNRKYGHNSGLFYEDEVDITGIRDDRFERHKPSLLLTDNQKDPKCGPNRELVPHSILHLLQAQYACPFPGSTVLHHSKKIKVHSSLVTNVNIVPNTLEIQDACESCMRALEQGKQVMESYSATKLDEPHHKAMCLHKWSFLRAEVPANSQDLVRLLKSLQPLLQDAIQKKRTTRLWESTYTITGPLTWKDFHKLAGRGTDEACEPQPIPAILVGYDKDWLSLAPHAIRYWEKLLLEPYGKARDVAFVVVAPENEFIHNNVKTFFKELSTVYELCRLGRHCPIPKLKDGIMRVGKKYGLSKGLDDEVSEWFTNVGSSLVASKLRMYAQVCRHHLAPYLADQSLDKALFENHSNKATPKPQPQPQPSPSPHPLMSDGPASVPTPQSTHGDEREGCESTSQEKSLILQEPEPDEDAEIPTIVVYMVDPFTYGNEWDELSRLSTLGMLRCYQEMVESLPETMRDHVQLQVVPLQSILDHNGEMRQLQLLKSVAFSVYTQCTQTMHHTYMGRSLTGFGPAASADAFLKVKEADKAGPTKLFSPPFIIAAQKDHQSQLAESCGEIKERCGILMVSYCLSEDQRWLIATLTDERGEVLESSTINIEIPNRNRRKKASARKIGLQKLWDFICGVISMTALTWRVVVCRLGRLGHGELKGWAGLLSRKNLLRACKHIRDICGLCSSLSATSTAGVPSILSACLISMEAQPTFRIVPDVVKQEEVQSSNCPLSTPKDATVTHILVFPTSATAAANTAPLQPESHMDITASLGADIDDDDPLFSGLKEDLNMNIDQDLNSFLSLADSPVPSPGSPGRGGQASPSQSPGLGLGCSTSPMFAVGKGNSGFTCDPQDESPNLLHQPLAMGYYVTTAKTGPLPKWFWSACPHAEGISPTCFKFALHVHCPAVQQNPDDLFHASHTKHTHSLDSNFTCDVLRYVLETYNSLSWLTMDVATNDRRSALPINFLVLMQLYHALNAFV